MVDDERMVMLVDVDLGFISWNSRLCKVCYRPEIQQWYQSLVKQYIPTAEEEDRIPPVVEPSNLDTQLEKKRPTVKLLAVTKRLFGFKMNASKGLGQNLDDFKKMTIELANAGDDEKLSDENEAIILLNSLPDSFKDVKVAIKYGRTSLSLEECIFALKSKDLELKIEKNDSGENLFVMGRQPVRNGKQHRLSFTAAQHNTKEVIKCVHSDLWRPTKVPTHGGNNYFISLIDDCSMKVWIYLLKSKDQAFDSFKAWKKLVDNQSSKKVKTLRTDNGLEFVKKEFNEFCSNEGIQ
ncbi:hypothetical protein EZV62_016769 [Acer yangbiense]|uniref:Integrase catalytic domain-containing protein n=1 Tax=Acer yangbiense TaxID=1000413 RepID=A0A5C7HPD6_9ROSI|nr:hypothetical protein EZV62_016769 [Acer yangbiense]